MTAIEPPKFNPQHPGDGSDCLNERDLYLGDIVLDVTQAGNRVDARLPPARVRVPSPPPPNFPLPVPPLPQAAPPSRPQPPPLPLAPPPPRPQAPPLPQAPPPPRPAATAPVVAAAPDDILSRAFLTPVEAFKGLPYVRDRVSPEMIKSAAKTARVARTAFPASSGKIVKKGTVGKGLKRINRTIIPRQDESVDVLFNSTNFWGNYRKGEGRIGEGSFKRVFQAVRIMKVPDGAKKQEIYAAAVSKFAPGKQGLFDRNLAIREYNLLFDLRNSAGIIPAISAYENEDRVIVITPFREYGDLANFREKYYLDDQIPILHLLTGFHSALQGIRKIHSMEILHRDIKPENFLGYAKDGKFRLDLADFGVAKKMKDLTAGYIAGTSAYLPPEVYWDEFFNPKDKIQSKAGDMWALGMTLFSMVVPPDKLYHFINFQRMAQSKNVTYEEWATNNANSVTAELRRRLPFNTDAEKIVSEVIIRLLSLDPTKRPTIEDLFTSNDPLYFAFRQLQAHAEIANEVPS